MAQSFREQIRLLHTQIEGFFSGQQQLAICLGSGISYGRMPMLKELIARAFRNLPPSAAASDLFLWYSDRHLIAERLGRRGIACPSPCTLEDFKPIGLADQEFACEILCDNFGELFSRLEQLCGGKRELLDLIGFGQFQVGTPDACHLYIGYLLQEGKLTHIVTTNWDLLIEFALDHTASRPKSEIITVVCDEQTYQQRNVGALQGYAKVHGTATQYPDHSERIVLTNAELQTAIVPENWNQRLLHEYLSGTVLFSGYSVSDYTLTVPLASIQQRRAAHDIEGCTWLVADEGDLGVNAAAITSNEPGRHLRLYANDLFSSLYFGWLFGRLRNAVEYERAQGRYARPFANWDDSEWNSVLNQLLVFLDTSAPAILDTVIGAPGARTWTEHHGKLPIAISNIWQLVVDGKVNARDRYSPLGAASTAVMVTSLIILKGILELTNANGYGVSASSGFSHCGLTLTSPSGSSRGLILLYGRNAQWAAGALDQYLSGLEEDGSVLPHPEITVVPCQAYRLGDELFRVEPLGSKKLRGSRVAVRTHIPPEQLFGASSYNNFLASLGVALELQ